MQRSLAPCRLFSLACRIILAVLLGSILSITSGFAAKIPVVASILPLGDFCQNIGGNRVEVQVLIPPGASPHVFEPSPGAVAQAMRAKVFVYVGAGCDPWAERLLNMRRAPELVVVEAVAGVPLLREVGPDRDEAGDIFQGWAPQREKKGAASAGARGEAGGNPHVWLDPVLAQDICRRLAAAFIKVDPEHRKFYDKNLGDYLQKLKKLNRDIETRVASFSRKDYVALHPAFAYFARRYGLREVGIIERSPGREPTPGRMKSIIEAIGKYKVRVIFAEPQLSPRMAEVIAREAGVKVLLLDPLGGRPPYGSDYLKLMRDNLATLAKAMQ